VSLPPSSLLPWALRELSLNVSAEPVLQPLAGDASQRRYFRLRLPVQAQELSSPGPGSYPSRSPGLAAAERSWILVDSPPTTQKNQEFLAIRQWLQAGGVRVPALLAADLGRGYMLLEDLGDQLLLERLRIGCAAGTAGYAEDCYAQALDLQCRMAAIPGSAASLPAYDNMLLAEELARFPDWFVTQLLGLTLTAHERGLLAELDGLLIGSALAQPCVFVHRDFHSRNLMCLADGALAVIDFQDAVFGPVTYDAVSLLKDCYICWPREQVVVWALAHRDALCNVGIVSAVDDATYLRWFDWMGLQRHLKVLGTFARLALRDGKAHYLQDLPLVLDYVQEVLALYASEDAAIEALRGWFETRLQPAIRRQPWHVA